MGTDPVTAITDIGWSHLMENMPAHDIELYTPEAFKILLEHEVNKSHRYGDSLTLINLLVEADPADEQTQQSAEVSAINALNVHLRQTDIPCKKANEFLILMPATAAPGARTACQRLRKLMTSSPEEDDAASFHVRIFMGMATLPNDDRSVSSTMLTENAAQALQHARTNQLTSVVSFSDLPK
jgi:GGDEF domain-containing protein